MHGSIKDTLKTFEDFKNKKEVYEVMLVLLICKGMYVLKVYVLSLTPTLHSFTFNFRFLYEMKHKVSPFKTVCGILFLLSFIFLLNKIHRLFDFKTS